MLTRLILTTILIFLTTTTQAWAAGTLTRLDLAADNLENNSDAFISSSGLSADGRYLAFTSNADNLVPNDLNNAFDVFIYDRWLPQLNCISLTADNATGNSDSPMPAISATGNDIAFSSYASNLISDDTNQVADIFLYDQLTHQLSRLSVSSTGEQGNGDSFNPVLSGEGRWIAFESEASNLVANDTNGVIDIFVHDRQTHQTQRISVTTEGQQSNGHSFAPTISEDGRYIAYDSVATNLSPQDTNSFSDVFLYDMQTAQTQLVSVATNHNEAGNGDSMSASISTDGRYLAFDSDASNLIANDNNNSTDIFLYDSLTPQTTLISVNEQGQPGNSNSFLPTLSRDGRYVVFNSAATNLVTDDDNGAFDVFKYDRETGQQLRVNVVNTTGKSSDAGAFATASTITIDGCAIAFASSATNLTTKDTNESFDLFLHSDMTENASFDLTTSLLTLPAIQVTGVGLFSANLTLADSNFNFVLQEASVLPDTQANTTCNYFSLTTGLLHLPVVKLVDASGQTTRYEVVMGLIPNSEPLRFELVKAIPLP